MLLLQKYYDTELYGTGGGIPDEVSKKVQIWVKPMDSLIDCFNDYEEQIARLKEENERLRVEGWISVEDTIPNIEQNVLVLRTNPTVVTNGYIHERGHWIWSNMRGSTHKEEYHKITHWQPLPEPPSPTKK